jgi:serine/threonine protein kinase
MADAATTAVQAQRLGLLTSDQVEEAWAELGKGKGTSEDFLRAMQRKGYLTPLQSSKLEKGDSEGFFLGGFRILYKIASGTFGRVYRADEPSSGRIVAIKVLRKKWSEDKHKIELFMREGKVGMTLRHPNIVEILAVSQETDSKQYYIVMEFVEGGNLRDFLAIRKKLAANDVLRILEDTSAGLAAAATKGITHRDMKLTNVLLSTQGPCKLVDFGLAGELVGITDRGGRVGEEQEEITIDRTVDYAGLEKVTGAAHGDPRSDIFFLGCIAYELLTARTPLEYTRSVAQRMSAMRFENIPPLTPNDAPLPVLRLVEKMMALSPDMRIQTASQLYERVRECRAALASTAGDAADGKAKSQATIFLVESDEKLQDVLRAKLKEEGFRILIAADPNRALDRFRQQPFDLLIVDASTTGENGYYVFDNIMEDAQRQNVPMRGILLINAGQTAWKKRLAEFPSASSLVQPVKYKQLLQEIRKHLGQATE